MTTTAPAPVTELDPRYSSPGAAPVPWQRARTRLAEAELYWLSTVRPGGRPHVTPLIAVWHDDGLHFCTGPAERKARNLAAGAHCVLTTGCNTLGEGLDVVVEGEATRVTGDAALRTLAGLYEAKYGNDWRFQVADGAFHGDGGRALVFRVAPVTAYGFAKGARFGQTRWRFPR
ncbi:pyridoxamine 5'-phosphate oxidase family protein [Streptomyces sp. JJ36]|uniref:pyridoxamine 5'-phosphate oxidase family protein n=1 Tax=Streptomyces sp. JJ36 TaxID=2736645 RepID=UPI001F226EF4|nr:pyridoxamine 5'-phosphate oxidase family protein [Streptomyces sp. JJ36]MCF6524787.1 pyridoxamine 5'-phosphate oxidase family protein [Streptomyces sp. JJ36]